MWGLCTAVGEVGGQLNHVPLNLHREGEIHELHQDAELPPAQSRPGREGKGAHQLRAVKLAASAM